MIQSDREQISRSLMVQWDGQLAKQMGTPLILIGLGHNEYKGKAIVCMTENASVAEIKQILADVIQELK